MQRKFVALLFCLVLLLSAATPLLAAGRVVLRVLMVKSEDPDGYVKELEKGKALIKRLGSSAVLRVWPARFAGENAGAIVVSAEYPSLAAMAKDEAAVDADAEYQAWIKGIAKMRTIVSDSLYTEMKP